MDRLVLTYTASTDLGQILTRVGDYLNVFIPASFFTTDYQPVLESQAVYGGRPYSPASDLVAIVCHMGILFPSEKPKKSSPNLLLTSPKALKFGHTSETTLFDDTRKIDDDFKFYGVVVTVVARPPLSFYPSVQGFSFLSQKLDEASDVSVDIVDFHFVSEFEPIPKCTDDQNLCLMHCENPDDLECPETDNAESEAVFKYSSDVFEGDAARHLFRDFVVSFVCSDCRYNVHEFDGALTITRVSGEEQEPRRVPLTSVRFGDDFVEFEDVRVGPVTHVIVSSETTNQ